MRPVRPTAVHKTDRSPSSSAATRSAATSSITRSACSRRRCGGSARWSCARPTRRACRPAPRSPSIASGSRGGHRRARRASADHDRARRGAGDPRAERMAAGHRRHRSADVGRAVGRHRALVGAEHLYFYDAISPIVLAETIDMSKVFRASRWDRKGAIGRRAEGAVRACTGVSATDGRLRRGRRARRLPELPADARRVRRVLRRARRRRIGDRARLRQGAFFEGCLPIEVMAHRGRDTLRFGPMKPVGLVDPRTGACRMRSCSCGRTTSPAITSASSASRRRSNGASRRACCG